MILSFSQKWPASMGKWAGQPTHFIEKIWAELIAENLPINLGDYSDYNDLHLSKFGKDMSDYDKVLISPKLHTIRHDPHNRWKPGMKIHPAIGVRTKNYFQFAPVIPCVSVQEIEIIHTGYSPNTPVVYVHNGKSLMNPLSYSEIKKLAQNDGFDSVEQFFAWFNKDFKGQLIHWSDLRY